MECAISTNSKSHGYQSAFSLDSCHGSKNLFGTFSGNYLLLILNRCSPLPPSLFNVVDALTVECEFVVNSGQIFEEGYNIVHKETRDSTQDSHLRSADRKNFLRFSHLQHFYIYSRPLGFILFLIANEYVKDLTFLVERP
ncbi:hypothetical protein AVEN_242094-1 [Araneus ventricosus]|uniref:Uncharacterized protein n=1 Tax=Araneus ventricosus TaxID=182803 RepID=A0A4Y2WTZ2_ARAVE|nr:hypothetical protein AVEN_242094-1 [Araneus ventricosus]